MFDNKTVLLLDDEPMVLRMITTMLQRIGCVVLPANTPSQAISIAKNPNSRIDLVITDVIMPEMNGNDLAALIREILLDIKILYMSGYTGNTINSRGVLNNGFFFLSKPFTQKELAIKIAEVFGVY